MGLDLKPLGKPKPGYEERFLKLFELIGKDNFPQYTLLDKLWGKKKQPTKEEVLAEWCEIQISHFETIKAPRVGVDKEADDWLLATYNELTDKPPLKKFLEQHQGLWVPEIAKEQGGISVYPSPVYDITAFRGKFLEDCEDILDKRLIDEAWETKLADEALDYGYRLMNRADELAKQHNLEYLKLQGHQPDDENGIEWQLHIVFSLAKWLIFYGKNGHGYEADF
jgi:hypothetical protein